MTRTLYIHVGPVKTGTSALQDVLRQHDNSVLIYPKVGLWGPGSHHGLVYSYFGETMRGKPPIADSEQLFSDIGACVNGADGNVLFSSEMFGPPPGSAKKRDLVAFVEAVLKHFSGNWRVEVLVTCRDHFERAASAYSQRIKGKSSRERDTPDEYLLRRVGELQYAPFIAMLRESGYTVSALNYHPATSWTTRFLTYVGLRPEQLPQSLSKNVSPSVKGLIAKLCANRTLQDAEERHRFLKLLKRMPGYYAPSKFIFGSDAVAIADQRFTQDREYLRTEFALELPDRVNCGNLFFLDFAGLEEIAAIARKLGPAGDSLIEEARLFLRPA